MFRNVKTVMVALNTPRGSVFSGQADGVEMRTMDGVIAIDPREESYLNLTQTTEITLRVGAEHFSFVLKNAAASLREGRLTVLAEEIQPVATGPVSVAPPNGGFSR